MGRLTPSQRHEAIGMLRYTSVSDVAPFLARLGKQPTFYKLETMQQAVSIIGLEA